VGISSAPVYRYTDTSAGNGSLTKYWYTETQMGISPVAEISSVAEISPVAGHFKDTVSIISV